MPLESFRHLSYFGTFYALTTIYNLTIPRGLEWKNFWESKTCMIDISSTIPSSYSMEIGFCKSSIKRIVEIFTWYQKILWWLNSIFSQTEHVKQRTIKRSLLSWNHCYVIKKKTKCCRSCGNRTTLTLW